MSLPIPYYWIALSHQMDQWHATAMKVSRALQTAEIVTTQEMLGEFLTAFRHTPHLRSIAARRVHQITTDLQKVREIDPGAREGEAFESDPRGGRRLDQLFSRQRPGTV